jgi:excisionase family DNA binding protein
MTTSGLLATREVAGLLGVTQRHVARLVENGQLKPEMQLPGSRGAYLFDRTYIEGIVARDRDNAKALAAQGEVSPR